MATPFYDDPGALNSRELYRDWHNPVGTSSTGLFSSAEDQNVAALPDIAQITQLINSINQTAQQASNAGRIPGGSGLERLSSANIGTALRGEVDPSVLNQIGQRAAERGVSTGSPGGAGSQAAFLRALGLNTMDLMNTGQNWLTQATNRNPGAPLFDPSNMFISPGQFGSLEMERLRLPRSGGSTGPTFSGGGGFGAPEPAAGVGMNWMDLFGGDNRGLTLAGDNFPYEIGTGGVGGLAQDASNFFDPFSNTMGADPFA